MCICLQLAMIPLSTSWVHSAAITKYHSPSWTTFLFIIVTFNCLFVDIISSYLIFQNANQDVPPWDEYAKTARFIVHQVRQYSYIFIAKRLSKIKTKKTNHFLIKRNKGFDGLGGL